MITSNACNFLVKPSDPVLQIDPPTDKVDSYPTSTNLDGWVTFSDKNDLYVIDIPITWLTGHTSEFNVDFYIDQFYSPDSKDLIEVFVSDDGRPFPEVDEKYIYALSVLKRIYANEVDVNVENRNVETNGRETLIWTSNNNKFISTYEVKNNTSFIMLTVFKYTSDTQSSEEINKIIASFRLKFEPLPESSEPFEYSSVAAALTDLKTKEGIEINLSQGWTIITETVGSTTTMWSFAPSDNPAYPAVAKRIFYDDQGEWWVNMNIHCEADKDPCDQFVRDFNKLNDDMRKNILKDQLGKYLEELQGIIP